MHCQHLGIFANAYKCNSPQYFPSLVEIHNSALSDCTILVPPCLREAKHKMGYATVQTIAITCTIDWIQIFRSICRVEFASHQSHQLVLQLVLIYPIFCEPCRVTMEFYGVKTSQSSSSQAHLNSGEDSCCFVLITDVGTEKVDIYY